MQASSTGCWRWACPPCRQCTRRPRGAADVGRRTRGHRQDAASVARRRPRPALRAMSYRGAAARAQHRGRRGSDRPGHPAAALAAAGHGARHRAAAAACSPTAPGRCTATAGGPRGPVGRGARSAVGQSATPSARPRRRCGPAQIGQRLVGRPSGYSGVVTSMRWRPANARNARASARVLDVTDRIWRS